MFRIKPYHILFVFSFFVCCLNCRAKNVVYVSSLMGNDMNSGESVDFPLRTIERALSLGDTILLKRGDVFFEKVSVNGKFIGAYGQGEQPVICGLKRPMMPSWINVGKNLWMIDLTSDRFSGFATRGPSFSNNIGALYEYDKDLVHGKRVQYIKDLAEDWDFFQTEKVARPEVEPKDFERLYLYLSNNPNDLKIEIAVSGKAMSVTASTIEGIAFKGFGDGLYIYGNSVVRGCKIDVIGGSQYLWDPNDFCSLGNGINFWINNIPNDNSLVENNIISRCYDCGVTIQGRPINDTMNPHNIVIQKNLIYDCCQGYESFLRKVGSNNPMHYYDCYFRNNIVVNIGNTSGFGYPVTRAKYCHVLSNNYTGSLGMIIENNTFVGGNYYCAGGYKGKYNTNTWRGNKCYIKRGDYILSNYFGTKNVIRIPKEKGKHPSVSSAIEDAVSSFRELTGDRTTKFFIKSENRIQRRINRMKRKIIQE